MLSSIKRRGIKPTSILDIGAHDGEFSKCARYLFPTAKIFAFEPQSDCFVKLCSISRMFEGMEVFNVALGSESGIKVLYRSSSTLSSSLLEMEDLHREAFPEIGNSQTVHVRVDTLDNLIDQEELGRSSLAKIDVQGYEIEVLSGATKALSKLEYIICEISFRQLYKGQPIFDKVYSFLLDAGFRYAGQLDELRHPYTLEPLQADVLFVKAQQL